MLNKFRVFSIIEGTSLLILLFIAMPAKYVLGVGTIVPVVGMVHGLLFMAYMVFSLMVSHRQQWSIIKWLLVFLAGVVPFGFFASDYYLRKDLSTQAAVATG